MEEFWYWIFLYFLQCEINPESIPFPARVTWLTFVTLFEQIFACIVLYNIFRVRHFGIASLAKTPARIADLILIQGFRRLFARHAEPTPPGKEAESNKIF
jgi:hypothetical protein